MQEVWKELKPNTPKVIWFNHVWFSQCVPRHSVFLWMAIKGRLKTQDMLSKWFNIQDMKCPFCSQCKDSHSHLLFNCYYTKRLWERLKVFWERLKVMSNLDGVSNNWAEVISNIVNRPARNTIWSVVQRLVLEAVVYFIWQDRNSRLFGGYGRNEEDLLNVIMESVRFRIMGLSLKVTPDVVRASEIWKFPIDRRLKYKRMLEELLTDDMVIDGELGNVNDADG